MRNNNHLYAVLMAGGTGTRFWPVSTTRKPKQFLDILGVGKTLIQLTYERLLKICPKENIIIVTHERYKEVVSEQLPEVLPENILYEPLKKNTAPCIAYANAVIKNINPDATVIVSPSDHLILKEEEYINTLKIAVRQAETAQCLVTLGIKPTRPDTGYGYIQFNPDSEGVAPNVKKVKTFTEKPDKELAKQFLQSGDFYWNSGIFIWTLKAIEDAFKKYDPHTYSYFSELHERINEVDLIKHIYSEVKNNSIDFAVMEKAENVCVVLSDFGWSDLGTWGALYEVSSKDDNQNVVIAKHVHLFESRKNIVFSQKTDKVVVISGLENFIVVDTPKALLICDKKNEQKIKNYVTTVRLEDGTEFV